MKKMNLEEATALALEGKLKEYNEKKYSNEEIIKLINSYIERINNAKTEEELSAVINDLYQEDEEKIDHTDFYWILDEIVQPKIVNDFKIPLYDMLENGEILSVNQYILNKFCSVNK